jgi:hypothetical protein
VFLNSFRFYSKFHKKRMEELSKQGILSFFNLFLTLACVGELEDVVRWFIVDSIVFFLLYSLFFTKVLCLKRASNSNHKKIMMFVMLLWVCIHTGQAEKFAWPRCRSGKNILLSGTAKGQKKIFCDKSSKSILGHCNCIILTSCQTECHVIFSQKKIISVTVHWES